ncbi:hypothetical protein [Streptomyces lydicus]|uniref:hypothetical protein n=1 Tax=Streptomyces lydicus TaxID=47763 RepID=UPI003793FC67
MRALSSACAASTALAATLLLPTTAYAHNAPGDNGTVKIHDAKTGEALKKNEPHVCTFYLDAFGFDGLQKVDWRIAEWPPTGTKNKTADSGTITLDTDGHGRTEDQKLPDGHYKLYWNFDGEKGAAKHKVFWVDCADQGGTGPSASASAPASPSSTASASATPATPSASGTPSESGTSSAQPGAPAEPSASATPGSGNLAETGSNAGVLTGVAVALLAAGGGVTLAMRRRARVQR